MYNIVPKGDDMNSEMMTYNALIISINNKLKRLNMMGYEVNGFNSDLEKIISSNKNNINENVEDTGSAVLEMIYSTSIEDLIKLNKRLDLILESNKISIEVDEVKNSLNINISEDTLDENIKILSNAIFKLNDLPKDNSNVSYIIENVYRIAYEIIKLELLLRDKSKMLDLLSNYDKGRRVEVSKIYLDNFVFEDLESLKELESNKTPTIDIELIRKIAFKQKPEIFPRLYEDLKLLSKKILSISSELSDKENEISIESINYDDLNKKHDFISKKHTKNKKKLKIKTTLLALYTVLLGFIAKKEYLSTLDLNIGSATYYMTTYQTIENNEVVTKKEYINKRELGYIHDNMKIIDIDKNDSFVAEHDMDSAKMFATFVTIFTEAFILTLTLAFDNMFMYANDSNNPKLEINIFITSEVKKFLRSYKELEEIKQDIFKAYSKLQHLGCNLRELEEKKKELETKFNGLKSIYETFSNTVCDISLEDNIEVENKEEKTMDTKKETNEEELDEDGIRLATLHTMLSINIGEGIKDNSNLKEEIKSLEDIIKKKRL